MPVAELWFGAHNSARSAAARREKDGFLEPFAGLAVVTHNVSEFGRVPGLKTEDWL